MLRRFLPLFGRANRIPLKWPCNWLRSDPDRSRIAQRRDRTSHKLEHRDSPLTFFFDGSYPKRNADYRIMFVLRCIFRILRENNDWCTLARCFVLVVEASLADRVCKEHLIVPR